MSFYADGIIDEIKSRGGAEKLRRQGPDTLYIGGGTPSILPSEELERVVKALGKSDYKEFTIEVNPGTVTNEKLKDLKVTFLTLANMFNN